MILRKFQREKLYKIAHSAHLSADFLRKAECPPFGYDVARADHQFSPRCEGESVTCPEPSRHLISASQNSPMRPRPARPPPGMTRGCLCDTSKRLAIGSIEAHSGAIRHAPCPHSYNRNAPCHRQNHRARKSHPFRLPAACAAVNRSWSVPCHRSRKQSTATRAPADTEANLLP